jgi:hypothetical protein
MANKKEQSVDSIIAAATGKMGVKAPPTGSPVDNGQQFDYDQPPITGPIDFGKMKPIVSNKAADIISTTFDKLAASTNEDAKYGKAFLIAVKTVKKFKVEKVEDFIELVKDIEGNL